MLAKKIALGFGIAIIFPMMIHYGVSSFVPKPKPHEYQITDYHLKYRDAGDEEKKELEKIKKEKDDQLKADRHRFQFSLFVVAVPLGLIAILLGAFMTQKGMGTGFMFGGIFSVCNGYMNNWNSLDDRLKFVSLLVAFGILIFVAFKKIEKKKEA